MCIGNFFTIIGMIINVIGVWYISRGIIKKDVRQLKIETGFSFGPNENYIFNGIRSKIECNIGFTITIIGALIQIICNFINTYNNGYIIPIIDIFIICAIFTAIFYVAIYAINTFIEKKILKEKELYIKELLKEINIDIISIKEIKRYLEYLGIKITIDNENDNDMRTLLKNELYN